MSRVHFEYTKSFWKEFPELKIIKDFSLIYNNDKSKDKIDSSQLMWAIQLCYHPDSLFYNIPNKEDLINKDFLKKDMVWSKIRHLVDLYIETTLSEAQRSMIMWEEQMRKRREFLLETEYNIETAKDLDTMGKATFGLYQDFDRIKKLLKEESTKDISRPKSLSESGEI